MRRNNDHHIRVVLVDDQNNTVVRPQVPLPKTAPDPHTPSMYDFYAQEAEKQHHGLGVHLFHILYTRYLIECGLGSQGIWSPWLYETLIKSGWQAPKVEGEPPSMYDFYAQEAEDQHDGLGVHLFHVLHARYIIECGQENRGIWSPWLYNSLIKTGWQAQMTNSAMVQKVERDPSPERIETDPMKALSIFGDDDDELEDRDEEY